MSPVLYAEDEPDDVFFLQLAWKEAGVPNPLVAVQDGQEAIRYLAGEAHYADRQKYPAPALLLLDLKLPIHSGFDVLRWLRQQPGLAALRVVILSGSDLQADHERARALGVIDYVIKPSSPALLTDIVRQRFSTWLQS